MARVNAPVYLLCSISTYFIFQVLVAGLKFFLGKDEDENQESDSDSEVGVVIKFSQVFKSCKSCHPADVDYTNAPSSVLLTLQSCFLWLVVHLTTIFNLLLVGQKH